MRRAIIHIGPKKTATSAIQSRLSRNRGVLASAGILYPGVGPNQATELSAMFCSVEPDHYRARRLSEDPERSVTSAANLARFDHSIWDGDWHTLILSAESMWEWPSEDIQRLAKWLGGFVDHHEILFTLRDPVGWAVSAAQQSCKSGPDANQILCEPLLARWQETTARFEAIFGAGSARALQFEDLVGHPQGPAAAFLDAAGLQHVSPMLEDEGESRNESLSWEAAMMMVALNQRRPFFIDDERNAKRSGAELNAFFGLAGQRFDLPDDIRRTIYEQSRADVAWAQARFGADRYDYPVERLAPGTNPDGVSAEFLTAVGDRLADMANEVRVLRSLLKAERLQAKGDIAGAEQTLRQAAAKFPDDRRIQRTAWRSKAR